jgi:cellulose synthase/poly-beta-1,6-N-acetylglucosamine synthase-like glycosyltransferase
MKIITITPHRGRPELLHRHLQSLANQTYKPDKIYVVCHGDTGETEKIVDDSMKSLFHNRIGYHTWHDERYRFYDGAYFIGMATPDEPWCKPLAINRAIRIFGEGLEKKQQDLSDYIIVTLDCDMLLHSEMFEQIVHEFKKRPQVLLHCPNLAIHDKQHFENWTYEGLRSRARVVSWRTNSRLKLGPVSRGYGGCQAALASWWHRVRGLDEDLKWWGMEDFDLHKRAKLDGLGITWLSNEYAMLHQWHVAGQHHPAMQKHLAKNVRICWTKLSRGEVVRNPREWGGMAS